MASDTNNASNGFDSGDPVLMLDGGLNSGINTLRIFGNSGRSLNVDISDGGLLVAGNVGIGTSTPEQPLDVFGNIRSARNEAHNVVESRSASNANLTPHFILRRSRGTLATPAYVQTGDTMGLLTFRNHTANQGASIASFASENHGAAAWGSNLVLSTIANGTNLISERMRITDSGNVGIGVMSPTEQLHVNGDMRLGVINPLNTGTFPAYGSLLYFSGGPAGPTHTSDNSDPIFIARYNSASDKSELRVHIGDNPQAEDSLNVGYSNAGVWYSRFTARMDGIGIFNNGAQTCTINPASGVTCSSDQRLKENINPIEDALDKVLAVNGVTFTWKNDESKEKKRELGFIAQNIEVTAPELVSENEQGYKQVNYANFVAVLAEGLKEFYQKWLSDSENKGREIASIQEQNHELNLRVERLEYENRELKKAVCEINPNADICKK